MIERIVKLTFKKENIPAFKQIFIDSQKQIEAMTGCHGVRLLQDIADERVFFTHSKWDSETHLNAYRDSALFGYVWPKTKALFEEKPSAWSVNHCS